MKKILFIIIILLALNACEKVPLVNLNQEELFALSFGRMENQIDLFQIEGVPFNKSNLIYMRDGKIYISNGNVSKVMEFTAYGDLVFLLYNRFLNTKPFILSSDDIVDLTNRLAREYPFLDISHIEVDTQKNLYVVDKVPKEQREYNADNNTEYFERILRFNKYGELVDFFGQEGVGGRGTPFSYIEGIFISSNDELVVISKNPSNLYSNIPTHNYMIYWFSNNGDILYKIELNSNNMPREEFLIPCIDNIAIDYNNKEIVIMVSYLQKVIDDSTGMFDLVSRKMQRIYHFSLEQNAFVKEINIPDTGKRQEWVGVDDTVLPSYEFIGITIHGYYFLIRPEGQNQHSLLILDKNGNISSIRNILVDDSEIFYKDLYLSRKGIIIGLLCYFREAKIVWWRSDKLLPEL
jgi:hypothetical protein